MIFSKAFKVIINETRINNNSNNDNNIYIYIIKYRRYRKIKIVL